MIRKVTLVCLMIALVMLAMPVAQAQVAVGVSIRIGPPPLPVYVQPPVPAPGYIWTPGFWAYGPDGYYWVPGTWVEPPSVGLLWTPGYWGWRDGFYVWNGGYWGPHVGFYGGINYGCGYDGIGFVGGAWRGGVFSYNRSVTNVNTTIIHNTYNTTVINNNTTINRTSFNGGTGGIQARPTSGEQLAMRERHIEPTGVQNQHFHAASTNRSLLASENHGNPSVAASSKPGVFSGQGVVAARGNNNFNRAATNNAGNQKFGGNPSNSTNSSFKEPFKGQGSKGSGPNNAGMGNASAYKTNKTYAGNSNGSQNNAPAYRTNKTYEGSGLNNAGTGNASAYRTNRTYAGNANVNQNNARVNQNNARVNTAHPQPHNNGQQGNDSHPDKRSRN